jgi:uncharacterized membrane protein
MTSSTVRHAYLDWVRGVAVLIMIEAHALDGWTHAVDRTRPLFGYAMILGGFGAPLFLFLAGLTGVLSAESKLRKTGDFAASWRAVQQRGWQVFGLAFLFRLQSYILSGAQSALSLLKVDILNVMGPAIAMTALMGRMAQKKVTRGLFFAAGAGAIALLTPIVRAAPQLAWLSDPVEWYFRPMPGRTNFTLFPWAGFVLAGAAVGVVVGGLRPDRLDVTQGRPSDVAQDGGARRLQGTLAIVGGLLVWLAHEASFRTPLHGGSDYWTTSLSFFLLRVGLLTLLLPIGYAWTHATLRRKLSNCSPLEEFGRASFFVYWIHVEMVYGFFSQPIRRSLSLEAALAVYVLFTVFLFGLVRLKSWLVEGRAIYLTDSKSVI